MTEHAKTMILLCLAVLVVAAAVITWAVAGQDHRSFPPLDQPNTITIQQGP